MSVWSIIGALVAAVIPLIPKIFSMIFKTEEQKKDEAVGKLPGELREIQDGADKADVGNDPSAINRIINRG